MSGKLLYIKVADGDAGKYLCKIIVDNQEYEGHFQLDTYGRWNSALDKKGKQR